MSNLSESKIIKPKYNLYLAGPLFDDLDNKELDIIENLCDSLGLVYFSPRLHSQLNLKGAKDKNKIASRIVNLNETAILHSQVVLANTRGLKGSYADSGTMYEIGYAVGRNIPVVTYTFNGYGLNIMISQRSIYHCTKIDFNDQSELKELLTRLFIEGNTKSIGNSFDNRNKLINKFKYSDLRTRLFDKMVYTNTELY